MAKSKRHNSRKNRTRRGGDAYPPAYPPASPPPYSPPYSPPASSGSPDLLTQGKDKVKGVINSLSSWFTGGKRRRRKVRGGSGVTPYDPSTINAPYGPFTSKTGGRRRRRSSSRKSRKMRR